MSLAGRGIGATMSVLALAASMSVARAADAPTLRAVLDAHYCDLQERLVRIHRSRDADPYARHIIIEPEGRPDAYVQCRFAEGDGRMQCEAASGYYPVQAGPRRPHPGNPAALAALGFAAQPDDNDALEFELDRPPELGRVSRLMLRALHDGFDFRVPTALVVTAPLAEAPGTPLPGCTPVS